MIFSLSLSLLAFFGPPSTSKRLKFGISRSQHLRLTQLAQFTSSTFLSQSFPHQSRFERKKGLDLGRNMFIVHVARKVKIVKIYKIVDKNFVKGHAHVVNTNIQLRIQ